MKSPFRSDGGEGGSEDPIVAVGPRLTAPVLPALSEKDWQRRVIDLAKLLGFRIYHHRPARVGNRVVTALEGDAGLPDLLLCKPPRLIFAELKVGRNKPSDNQEEWLRQLGACRGVEAYVWTPPDWDEVVEILRTKQGLW